MLPLEAYICDRMGKSICKRLAFSQASLKLPACLGNLVRKKLWGWPYRHMSGFPHSVIFEPTSDGTWRLANAGLHLTETVPLKDWIGSIDRPVTIVAGGPSAREYPMQELASGKRLLIAVNGVPTFLAEHGIRPDAWVVSDARLAPQIQANAVHANGVPLAITPKLAAFLAVSSPALLSHHRICLVERVNQWHGVSSLISTQLEDLNKESGSPFLFPTTGQGKSVIGWSKRPELGFFSGATVTFTALQLMVGLGARDIEIIGMDLSGKGHSYVDLPDAIPSSLMDDFEVKILPAFEQMHQGLLGTGVVIKNLSPVCRLPQRLFAS